MFLPIPVEYQPGLIADLEGDPFVGHALSTAVRVIPSCLLSRSPHISTVNLDISDLGWSWTKTTENNEQASSSD